MRKKTLVAVFAVFSLLMAYGYGSIRTAGATTNLSESAPPRTLSFYNTHTREKLTVSYWKDGHYTREALEKINWHLRDHRAHQETQMSSALMNLLYDIKVRLKAKYPEKKIVFHVISGYRSPDTNAMLRANGGGQAKKSRHMHGDAIDIRVPGVSSVEIRNVAWCLQRGGVGYYRGSNFVHVDMHDVRFWNWSPSTKTCGEQNS